MCKVRKLLPFSLNSTVAGSSSCTITTWRVLATSTFSIAVPEYSSSNTPFHGLLLLDKVGAEDMAGRLFPVFNSTKKCLCSDIGRLPIADDRQRRRRLPPETRNPSVTGP